MTLSESSNQSDNKVVAKPSHEPSEIDLASQPNHQIPEVKESQQFVLLEEKLKVDRRQQKIGEVVVRKQVETKMIEIPVRREKLIVEQIDKNTEKLEQLIEVVIKQEKVNGFEYEELSDTDSLHITKSSFLDPQTAQKLLYAIAKCTSADSVKVRLELVTNCSEHQIEHQTICDRYSN